MTIQRAKLNLGAGVFRISQPGIDLSSALDYQLLLSENYFYGQVVETGLVSLPTGNITYTINFVNDLGFIPTAIIWPIMYSQIVRPGSPYARTGFGGAVFYTYSQPNNTQLLFNNPNNSDLASFYYQVLKTPRA